MNSMTGYGKFTASAGGKELTVEIKSVNNRYLEINLRLPKILSSQEDVARKILKSKIGRGTVDAYFNYTDASCANKRVVVDENLVAGYVDAARLLSEKFGIPNDFSVSDAMKIPEALKVESEEEDDEQLACLVTEAVTGACDALVDMRLKEGEGIKTNLTQLLDIIADQLEKVRGRADGVVADYKVRIAERIAEMLADVETDETKLLNEVAFFADKADIYEEISRLGSHISQFRGELEREGQTGRKLDFLSQEMNREINTMGSKANDYDITTCVLKMKNELEKIKEQIRNVE